MRRPVSQRFAFRVDDIDETVRELARTGVEPRRFERPDGSRQAFLRDPSGNLIEPNQPF